MESQVLEENKSDKLEEEWKVIKDFPKYMVSNLGRVINKFTDKEPYMSDNHNHWEITFRVDKKVYYRRVHLLVMEAFGPPKPGPEYMCRHLDGNTKNNRIDNLCWGTHKENINDRLDNPNDTKIKFTRDDIIKIKNLLIEGKHKVCEIAKMFGVSSSAIQLIKNGHHWPDIGPDLSKYNIKRKRKKLDADTVRKIRKLLKTNMLIKDIAAKYDIGETMVSGIKRNIYYKWVK